VGVTCRTGCTAGDCGQDRSCPPCQEAGVRPGDPAWAGEAAARVVWAREELDRLEAIRVDDARHTAARLLADFWRDYLARVDLVAGPDSPRPTGSGAPIERNLMEIEIDLAGAEWRKSSFSTGNDDNCVEVAFVGTSIAVRDTKNREGGAQMYALGEWRAFLEGVKAGEFNI
jgi:hypothetical protein